MKTKDRKKYLESNGYICPYCESNNLEASELDQSDYYIYQHIVCSGCEKEWIDKFTLTDVELFEEEM